MKRQLGTGTGSRWLSEPALEDANTDVIGIEEATTGLVHCSTAQSYTAKWLLARSNGDNLEDLLLFAQFPTKWRLSLAVIVHISALAVLLLPFSLVQSKRRPVGLCNTTLHGATVSLLTARTSLLAGDENHVHRANLIGLQHQSDRLSRTRYAHNTWTHSCADSILNGHSCTQSCRFSFLSLFSEELY